MIGNRLIYVRPLGDFSIDFGFDSRQCLVAVAISIFSVPPVGLVERQMAFFHQLIIDLEHEREARPLFGDNSRLRRELTSITQHVDVPEEVIKFAPKKMRLQHQSAEGRIEQLETDVKQWQDRADQAEARLRSIESSIQQIAARYCSIPTK